MSPGLWMVFDVESVGLHGEGFAVGWVVVDREGHERACGYISCRAWHAAGTLKDRKWVTENVLPCLPDANSAVGPQGVRAAFWYCWLHWKAEGAVLAADVPWPVESRFLAQCIDDYGLWGRDVRTFEGPYPLVDVASVRLGAGFDPLATEVRLPGELPQHHPLYDARQSARLLLEALALARRAGKED